MAELGSAAIVIALALAAYSAVGSFAGAHGRRPGLAVSAHRATYMAFAALAVATLALITAFLRNDFSIQYVAENSNLAMPRGYTWVAFYAGNAGSLLYVATALSLVASLTVRLLPERLGVLRPYTNGVMMLVLTFYLAVMALMANPFNKLAVTPADGQGINPLLTHPGMFIHPPMIMIGLIATTVPFALAMAGLLARKVDDDWVDWGRAWGSWLGCCWALVCCWAHGGPIPSSVGGGYWAWDPVENAALMPWLGLTAFIHSIMVQKRRGMFRMWNIALINITFTLGNFGVFINRGGPVPSVHSFGASTLGWVFLLFLAVTVVVSFGLFFYRIETLKSARRLESALSREASFLVNNLLLLGIAFVTMWGVVFPLISEAFSGRAVTVAAPFYNQVNGPLLLALIFLMGVGPSLPWRRATWATVRRATASPGRCRGRLGCSAGAPGSPFAHTPAWLQPGRLRSGIGLSGMDEGHPRPPQDIRGPLPARLPAAHGCQPAPVRRIHRPPCGGHVGLWHRRILLLRPGAGRDPVRRGTDLHRPVRGGVRPDGHDHLPGQDGTNGDHGRLSGRRLPGHHRCMAGRLPQLPHALHQGCHPLNPGGGPVRAVQRGAARRRECRLPAPGQPHGLVDVVGRRGDGRGHRRGLVAGAAAGGGVRRRPVGRRAGAAIGGGAMVILIITLLLVASLLVVLYPLLAHRTGASDAEDAAQQVAEGLRRERDRIYEELQALQQERFLRHLSEEEYQAEQQAARTRSALLLRRQQQVQEMAARAEEEVEEEIDRAGQRDPSTGDQA